jgi:hypothetical protein
MDSFEQNYSKNLDALKNSNPRLYNKLSCISENNRFEAVPVENKPFNIIDTASNTLLYENNETDSAKTLKKFHLHREHLFLYFFGIGNGHLCKELLKNTKQHLTIIESSLELLFVAFHLEDFSNEILLEQISFFLLEDLPFSDLVSYLNQKTKIYYARLYELHTASPYYDNCFFDKYVEANKLMVDAIEFIITNAGNSIEDALIGLHNHIYNIPYMVSGSQFKTFIKEKNTNIAIMVSTGPSLTKQLSQLKKIQNYATIICADSALRILYDHDITPDICVSLERIEYVAELFKDLPTEYKQKVIFVRASLQHKCVFETIEGCQDILVMRPYPYNKLFGLDEYGILCSGTSVANMAHELCTYMDFKTCIIIGQDLAYGKDGITHSKGHILGEKDESIIDDFVEVEAYGGKGTVKTNSIWALFRNGLIQTVDASKHAMTTVNSTEGGASIPQTVELPFKDAIQRYVDMSMEKATISPTFTSNNEAIKYYKTANNNIQTIVKEGMGIQKTLENAFIILAEKCKKLENKSEKQQIKCFDDAEIMVLLELISNTRNVLEENFYFENFYWQIMQSIVVHYELDLASIKVLSVSTPEENKLKALKWIHNHSHYFYTMAGMIQETIYVITNAQKESCEELPDRLKFILSGS